MVALAGALAALVNLLMGFELPAPWSLPDELIYSEIAKSLADGSLPAVRGEATAGYGVVYPLLIAPAWAAFDNVEEAYVAAKVINALAMGLAAFPAFFLAKRFVSIRAASVVSAFSVFVPSMLYAGSLLTEVALYPLMLLALLGIVAAVQNPTVSNQLMAVGGIGLAYLTKPMAAVLVPAYVLALVQLGLVERSVGGSVRRRLQSHSTSLCVFASIALLVVAVPAVLGDPTAALGSYGVVAGHIDLSGTVVWFLRHAAELDLYVAIAPFAASLIMVCLGIIRTDDRATREFSAVALWVVGGFLLVVAGYASEPLAGGAGYGPTEARLHERNMFVLAPLLLIGLALFFERGKPGTRVLKSGCVALSALFPAVLPLGRLIHNANLQALAIIPWAAESIRGLWPFTLLPLALAASLVVLGRRSSAVWAWALVGLVFAVTTLAAHASQSTSAKSRSTAGVGTNPSWIDDAVPRASSVLVLWSGPGRGADLGRADRTIWMNEFYNRTVGTVVEIGAPMPYALPHVKGRLHRGVLVDGAGDRITTRYVLAPCWLRVRGAVIARDPRTGSRVYRVSGGAVEVATAGAFAPRCIRGSQSDVVHAVGQGSAPG